MKDDDNGGSAGSTPVASNVSSAATEQSGRQGLQLMKDDDNNANEGNPPAAQDSGTQPTAGGMQLMKDDDGGTSQSQAAVAPAPLPQQADASQTTGATSQPDNQSQQKVVNFSGVPVSQANLQTGQAQGGGRNSGSLPVIDPHAVVDPEVVSGVNPGELTAEDKALMGHQWQMSIDPRYLTDPQVIANMNNIWAAARKNDAAANDKLKTVMADQLKAHGMTHQQIDDFFNKFQDIADGQGPVPSAWNDTSEVANDLDIELGAGFVSHADDYIAPKYYSNGQILTDIEIKRSVQAPNIAYQGHGPQTEDDCVLHAIANGAQVPFGQVQTQFKETVHQMAMDPASERQNPEIAVMDPKQGGNGGLNGIEELSLAEKFGQVIPVPNGSYARAIATTHRPVLTTVDLNPPHHADHKVLVTGVYEAKNGRIYYSVMDSNLDSKYKNSTAYVEKNYFEDHLSSGGFVVIPR
ncbi:MAG: hypothetical protein KGJ11_04660 [Candidatus Omnitrophica bacterium]|nr:hypothetical protein [Candidatus Omnitrophota bacterium]